jgi:ATP-dependent DNA helicase RecQ
VFRQLVALGHLRADGEAFGALKLTQTARQVLKGETSVMLREQAVRPSRVRRGKQTVGREAVGGVAAPESALLRALRAWRLGIAREHGVPAFVVFHDSTLETIAALRPGTREALRGVSGVGEKKLERYGEALLEVVRSNSV